MIQQKIPSYFIDQNDDHLIKKDIILVNDQTQAHEYYTKVPLIVTLDNKLSFSELINHLKAQTNCLNRSILYLQTAYNKFSLVGADPFNKVKYIDYSMIKDQETIVIKYFQNKPKINDCESDSDEVEIDDKITIKAREKRVKERKIIYVREKVNLWRTYYEQGYLNLDGSVVKVNLDTSANMVGLSRKTLDDYYAILRKAEALGFDFKYEENQKMGYLRKFVKDKEKNQKCEKQKKPRSQISNSEIQSQISEKFMLIIRSRPVSPKNMFDEDNTDKVSQMSIENILDNNKKNFNNNSFDIDQFLILDDNYRKINANNFSDNSPDTSITMNN